MQPSVYGNRSFGLAGASASRERCSARTIRTSPPCRHSNNEHNNNERDNNEHNNNEHNNKNEVREIGVQRRVPSQAEQAEALAAAAAEMMEQRGLPSLHSLTPADDNLRVLTVSNLFEPSEARALPLLWWRWVAVRRHAKSGNARSTEAAPPQRCARTVAYATCKISTTTQAPNPNRDGGEAYTAWEESMVDDLWAECCRHGEVNLA